jgi:MYXO-CTERM domain-containing protein
MRTFTTVALAVAALAVSAPAAAIPRDVRIAYLQRLDWHSDYPECMNCFVAHPAVPGDWSIHHEAVDLTLLVSGEQSITGYDLAIMTGHVYYALTDEERTLLESYVSAGGVLWFDDCGAVEVDNLPFGMEINFGGDDLGAWGTCYGDLFTVHEPDHPLMRGARAITAPMMRTDAGLNDSQWFTPFIEVASGYTTVVSGRSVGGVHLASGPAIVAGRAGRGMIVATAMDVSCALECLVYRNSNIPLADYYLVLNMLAWHDADNDDILDRDEGAFETTAADTDGDTEPDALDFDTDGDTIPDWLEAGDAEVDTTPVDTDGDATPDFRDDDSDGDTIPDAVEGAGDADGDAIPDFRDDDSDGDTVPDADEGTGDADGDTTPDFRDSDDTDGPLGDADGDTVPNDTDNCPDDRNPEQEDADGDTIGDACDDTPHPADGGTDGGDDGGTDAVSDAPYSCDPAICVAACRASGASGGRCEGSACFCDGLPDGGTSDDGGLPGDPTGGGGCGCRTAPPGGAAWALLLFLALAARSRGSNRRCGPPAP